MTDQETNIAVAEACGWVKVRAHWEKDGEMRFCDDSPHRTQIPNYTGSLDAMATAEAMLTKETTKRRYAEALVDELERSGDIPHNPATAAFVIATASARQRATAFLAVVKPQ